MNIAQLFDKYAENYDAQRKQLIPCHDDFYNIALEIIPFDHKSDLSVLDLGAGTGQFSVWIASLFPNAKLTLIDIAPGMLKVAKKNFSNAGIDRVSFVEMDYVKEDIGSNFDLIFSSFSIHHLPDEQKKEIFNKSHKALNPGGFFVNADQILGESPRAAKICHESWLRKVRENGASEEVVAASLERMKEDRLSPLSSQIKWLGESGFIEVSTWYQYYDMAVYSGVKAPPSGTI